LRNILHTHHVTVKEKHGSYFALQLIKQPCTFSIQIHHALVEKGISKLDKRLEKKNKQYKLLLLAAFRLVICYF
jgi:hypothetical protein